MFKKLKVRISTCARSTILAVRSNDKSGSNRASEWNIHRINDPSWAVAMWLQNFHRVFAKNYLFQMALSFA